MSHPLLESTRVTVDLGGRRVLHDASLRVEPGEVVGLVGRNGSGKTTLLRAALGLAALKAGEIRLSGDPVSSLSADARARRVGYLPQERIIGWNLACWRVAALGAPLRSPDLARALGVTALTKVGAEHLAERRVLDLSGGERANILLARLLATEATLLVTDEPIAGLDPAAQLRTLSVLREHARTGGGVLTTLHDLTLARLYCDRLVVMAEGRVVADGPADRVLSPDVLQVAFGLREIPRQAVLAGR